MNKSQFDYKLCFVQGCVGEGVGVGGSIFHHSLYSLIKIVNNGNYYLLHLLLIKV
jgi:hypothetical protein